MLCFQLEKIVIFCFFTNLKKPMIVAHVFQYTDHSAVDLIKSIFVFSVSDVF